MRINFNIVSFTSYKNDKAFTLELKSSKMKTLIKKIDSLTDQIEMGFYTKSEAMFKLRQLRSEVAEKFEEGSDKFMQCIYPLIDANEIAKAL